MNWCRQPHGLRRSSAASRLLGLRVRIPPWAWMSCECSVWWSRGLRERPITRREVCLTLISEPQPWKGLVPLRLSSHGEYISIYQMRTFRSALSKNRLYSHINLCICVSTEVGHLQAIDAHACETEDVLLVACFMSRCVQTSARAPIARLNLMNGQTLGFWWSVSY